MLASVVATVGSRRFTGGFYDGGIAATLAGLFLPVVAIGMVWIGADPGADGVLLGLTADLLWFVSFYLVAALPMVAVGGTAVGFVVTVAKRTVIA